MKNWDQNCKHLLYIYLAIALAAAGMHCLINYCYGAEAADFLLFGSPGKLLLIAAILTAFTWIRIGVKDEEGSPLRSNGEQAQRWIRLAAFPRELAWCYIGAGLALMLLEGLVGLIGLGGLGGLVSQSDLGNLAGSPGLRGTERLLEAGALAVLALVHYSAARLKLRAELARLQVYQVEPRLFGSAGVALLGVVACGLLYGLPRSVAFAAGYGPAVPGALLAAAWGAVWAAFMLTAFAIAAGWLRGLERMAKMLHQLAAGGRSQLRRRIPLASPFETGEFLAGYNKLQDRFEAAYARLDDELDLALRVQQLLLVRDKLEWQRWSVQAEVGSLTEAGGGFCDIQLTSRGRLALAAGAVIGEGPPAALMMSALVMLFRTRLQQADSAEALLQLLDEALSDIGQGGCRANLGVVLLDAEDRTISYALSGPVSMYIELPGAPVLWAAEPGAPQLGSGSAPGYIGQRIALPDGEALLCLHGGPHNRILARRSGVGGVAPA